MGQGHVKKGIVPAGTKIENFYLPVFKFLKDRFKNIGVLVSFVINNERMIIGRTNGPFA
jgi:hypothetical protein